MEKLTFVCEPIRRIDGEGNLVSAGLHWREGTQLNRGRMMMAGFCMCGSLLAFALAVALNRHGGDVVLVVAVIALGAAAILALWPSRDRVLEFSADDGISVPRGLKYSENSYRLRAAASDVISIEVAQPQVPDQDKFRHDVVLVMDDGRTIRVAGDLHQEHAVRVARQLTKALGEIRATQGQDTFFARA